MRKNTKLWGGAFDGETAASVDEFNQSVTFDQRLALFDIDGSLAHAAMLAEKKLISKAEYARIEKGLATIRREITDGKFRFRKKLEDVHMNIEARLTELAGDAGRKLHTARSRNDQVALDFRLYVRAAAGRNVTLVRAVQKALVGLAVRSRGIVIPGRTHLQAAQPVTAVTYVLSFVEALERDRRRLNGAHGCADVSPLGAGAGFGTTLDVDPRIPAARLGMRGVMNNPIDAVSARDFALEYLAALAILSVNLSRLAEDWIIFFSEPFGLLTIGDRYTTGSSIMPQKKNPDVLELVRGKTGRIIGDLTRLLVVMKGLPLAYNKDMQEDKEAVFDADDTISETLKVVAEMIGHVNFDAARAAAAVYDGHLNATLLSDYLVEKGMPFRTSHGVVGRAVAQAHKKNMQLGELGLDELKTFSALFERDVYERIDPRRIAQFVSGLAGGEKGKLAKWQRILKSS